MKRMEIIKKAKRLNILIIILSIVSLSLISLLPWISVHEEDLVKGDLYFNFDMMSKSNNKQIRDLASDLNLINILLWALIVLGMLSIIGTIIHGSGKSSAKGYIFLVLGVITLIFSILVLVLQLIFINTIGKIDNISASVIFPHMNYAYIPLLFDILLLVTSIKYFWAVITYSVLQFTSIKKEKDSDMKQVYKKNSEIKAKEKPTLGKISLKSEIVDDKRGEIEQLLRAEIQKIEKQPVKKSYPKFEREDQINLEDIEMLKQTSPEIKSFEIKERKTEKFPQTQEKVSQESYKEMPFMDNNRFEPFSTENKKEEIKKSDDKPLSVSFEEALSSAIQKKQSEIMKQETTKDNIGMLKKESEFVPKEMILEEPKLKDMVEKQPQIKEEISPFSKEKFAKKKISLRCPQCSFIFTFEKDEKTTNIICPKCSKEGVIK